MTHYVHKRIGFDSENEITNFIKLHVFQIYITSKRACRKNFKQIRFHEFRENNTRSKGKSSHSNPLRRIDIKKRYKKGKSCIITLIKRVRKRSSCTRN